MSVNEIVVTAPGKIILHGEHAVVFGKAAIAATLDLRCKLTLKKIPSGKVTLDLPDISVHYEWPVKTIEDGFKHIPTAGSKSDPIPASDETVQEIKKFLGHHIDNKDAPNLAVIAFLYIYHSLFHGKGPLPSLSILMESEIPVGAGLGSSAAFSVSLAASLLEFSGCIASEKTCDSDSNSTWSLTDRDTINRWAFIGEKVMHGRPSGIDNSVSTYGGALKFQNGKITHIDKMPTLKAVLVNTKVPRSTLTLVGVFQKKYSKHQAIFDPVLNAIEAITEKSMTIFKQLWEDPKQDDYQTLGELIDMNHQLLRLMGVSHASLEAIVSASERHNLKAKLTGAGGGGCAFVLIPPDTEESVIEALTSEMETSGFRVWRNTSIGGQGVIRHL